MLCLPKGLRFFLLFCFLLAFGALFVLANNGKGKKVSEKTEAGVSPSPAVSSLPSDLEEKIQEVKEILIPWEQAEKILPTPPVLPTEDQIVKLYSSLKTAVFSRDKRQLNQLVAQDRIWYFENPKEFLGEGVGGKKIYQRQSSNPPQDNFPELLYLAPEAEEIEITNISLTSEPDLSLKSAGFYLIDKAKSQTVYIAQLPWQYTAEVETVIRSGGVREGEGVISFVYDIDRWKYHGEIWNFQSKKTVLVKGDSADKVRGRLLEAIPQGNKLPLRTINLKVGDGVVWRNIFGIIYTYQTSGVHWNSPFLLNDDFIKVFTQKATYNYKILGENTTFIGEINVE